MKNKVLVIGSGGREHALAWRLSLSTTVIHVYVAPGNPGTESESNVSNIDILPNEVSQLITFCKNEKIDLVIVGPEQPLCDGIVDEMSKQGINCFGPSALAAQLEGSKSFSKDFLKRYNIPTAKYQTFKEVNEALNYLKTQDFPIVIKADGLAAGKGVIIAKDFSSAEDSVKDMLSENVFGDAGSQVVIEDFLEGEEASFIVVADGENFVPLATSQDHKTRDNNDKGPNTGGMGAYSPAPVVTNEVFDRTVEKIIKPTLEGMNKDGNPFVGFLYVGLMIDSLGEPFVVEFNVRMGDPETQPIMMRLQSNLDELCIKAIKGKLLNETINWDKRKSLGVVLVEKGYPKDYKKGSIINGINACDQDIDTKIFHSGTKRSKGKILTNGGRVLCVCALADEMKQVQMNVYQCVDKISWSSLYYRTDIGFKALL